MSSKKLVTEQHGRLHVPVLPLYFVVEHPVNELNDLQQRFQQEAGSRVLPCRELHLKMALDEAV